MPAGVTLDKAAERNQMVVGLQQERLVSDLIEMAGHPVRQAIIAR
jgi:hypothetical protein